MKKLWTIFVMAWMAWGPMGCPEIAGAAAPSLKEASKAIVAFGCLGSTEDPFAPHAVTTEALSAVGYAERALAAAKAEEKHRSDCRKAEADFLAAVKDAQ